MRRAFTTPGVGYAGTALLVLATLPVMYLVMDRRLGALLCALTLMMLFTASVGLDASPWRETYAAKAARSAKWFALGFSAFLVVALIAGLIPKT
jgi:hypothetical protein